MCDLSPKGECVPAFTRKKRTWANEQEGKYFHGCRFIDINTKEQERMVREIFLLQRDEIRRRNGQ